MKIKVLVKSGGNLPVKLDKGDWFDLMSPNENITISGPEALMLQRNRKKGQPEGQSKRIVKFYNKLIDLNIAMQLPKGYEAVILPRSSAFNNYGIILCNMQGVIDNSYCGENDTWKANVLAFRNCTIPANSRIAQFRIQLNQNATFWQKVKWLF